MKKKRKKSLLVSLCVVCVVLLGLSGNADAAWTTVADVVGGDYVSITTDGGTHATHTTIFGAKAGGGVDQVVWDDGFGWGTNADVTSGNYASITAGKLNVNELFGAKVGGGLDLLQYWSPTNPYLVTPLDTAPGSFSGGEVYDTISATHTLRFELYGSGPTEGLNLINNWSAEWYKHALNYPGTGGPLPAYDSIAADGTHNRQLIGTGTGADYGTDYINNWDVEWYTHDMGQGIYASVTAVVGVNNEYYGAKAGGGVDHILYNGFNWVATEIAPGTYVSITGDTLNPYKLYGAKAAGGVDMIEIPEPATMGLLLLGGFLVRRRRV